MKKLISMLGVCGIVMLLTACGSTTEVENPTPTPTEAATPTPTLAPTATSTPTPEPTATSTPTPEPTATSTPTPEPTSTPTPVPRVEDTYVKGTITESGFESEWMNLRFTVQPGVFMQSQEEMDEVMRQSVELLFGDTINYSELSNVMEMRAYYLSGTNVAVQVERLPVLYSDMTEEEYIAISVENLRKLETLQELTTGDFVSKVEIGGEEYTAFGIVADYGTGIYYQDMIVRKKENRMITITLTYRESSTEEATNLLRTFGAFNSESIVLPTPTPIPSTYETGVLTETGFESEWMNLRFTATDEVTMLTREELLDLMPLGAMVMFGDEAENVLENVEETLVIEMMARHDSDASVLVQVEALPSEYEILTVDEYLPFLIYDMKNAVNVDYTVDETLYTIEISGESYKGFSCMADTGTDVYYQEFIVRKKENRMISIIISYEEENIEDAQYLVTLFGNYDSEPVVVPTETPTGAPVQSEDAFQAGVVTENGYENEWLDLRITLPEGVTMTDESVRNEITLEMEWEEYGIPIVQLMVSEAEEGEETAEGHIEMMKDAFVTIGEMRGMFYSFDEELYLMEIGGQEYVGIFMTVEMEDGYQVYQDYCVRMQDGYAVAIVFSYIDGFDEELQEALNTFSAY